MIDSPIKRGFSGNDRLAIVTIAVVVVTIAFAAASFGAVEPWSELPLIFSGVLLSGLTVAQVWQRDVRRIALPLILLAIFGLLASFSLLPLPTGLAGVLSPQRASTTSELLGKLPNQLTLSYYPSATKHGLKLFLIGTALFAAVATNLTRREHVEWLLTGLFGVGIAEALLAIAQTATSAKGIYWSDLTFGAARSGSFINYSHFSQFLNLTMGAGLGLLLVRLSKQRTDGTWGHDTFGTLFRRQGWLLTGLTLHAVAIASSMSRNGAIAMVVAGALVACLLGRRNDLGWRAWLLVALPPLVFGGLVLVGFDAFYERLATLEDKAPFAARWELSMATLHVAFDHPLFGTGLNTHAYVFPAYDPSGLTTLAEQADNDYAQLVEETGLLGVAVVISFLATLVAVTWRRLASSTISIGYALYGVTYGLIAVSVQSLTDFGQRLPAVFCVAAALCGIVIAITANLQRNSQNGESTQKQWPHPTTGRWLAISLMIAAIPLWGWAANETLRDYRAEQWWALAYTSEQQIRHLGTDAETQDYIDLVAAAEMAAELRPDNVEYAFWLNAYRWQMMLKGYGGDWQSIAASSEGKKFVQMIVDRLAEVRLLCPTYGPPCTLEGQLRLLTGDPTGARLIRLGGQLTPHNPLAILAVAELEAATEGPHEEVRQLLHQAVALDSSLFKDACSIFVDTLQRPDWAHDLAGKEVNHLRYLANFLDRYEPHKELSAQLLAEANGLREDKVKRGVASANDMASVAVQRAAAGEHEAAVQLFREALATNYDRIDWRLALSNALVELGRYEEAYREARTCFRIRPGSAQAKRRMEEISLLIPAPGISFQLPSSSKATSSEAAPSETSEKPEAVDTP